MARTAFESLPEAPDAVDAIPEETNHLSDSFFQEPSKLSGGQSQAGASPIVRARSVTNRIRAEDLAARGIPSYRNASGDVSAVRDESGAALTGFQQKAGIAYDSKGQPKAISYDETGPPKISDPFENIPARTDPKTGAIEKYGPGGIYQYVGQDPDVTSKVAQQASDKELGKESALMGRKLTLDEHDLVQGTKQQKVLHEDLLNAVPALRDPKFHGADQDTVKKAIDEHFDTQYAAPEANATSGFFSGELSPDAKALRTNLDAQKAKAHEAADQIFDLNDKLSDLHDNIQSGRSKERAQVETLLAHQQGKTGPLDEQQPEGEAAKPAQLYPDPKDWPRMLGGAPHADTQQATPRMSAEDLTKPFATGEKSYRVGDDNSFHLDPNNMIKGVRQAMNDGLIAQDKAKEVLPQIKPLQDAIDARNQLIKDAGGYSQIKAFGHGAAIGAGFLAAAGPGAAGGAEIGSAAGPIGTAAGAAIGGLITGSIGAWGVKKAIDKLGEYDDRVKSLAASADLHPITDAAGQFVAFASSAPKAAFNLVKLGRVAAESVSDLGVAAQSSAATKAIGKYIGVQGLTGAAFGGIVLPAFDKARYAAADAMGISHDQFQGPTAKSVLAQAALGILVGGNSVKFKDYSAKDVASVLFRARARNEVGLGMSEASNGKVESWFAKQFPNMDGQNVKAGSEPLTRAETDLYNALKTKVERMQSSGAFDDATGIKFSAGTQAQVRGLGGKEGPPIVSAGVEATKAEPGPGKKPVPELGEGPKPTQGKVISPEEPAAPTPGGKSNEQVSTSTKGGKAAGPSSSEPARPESKVAQPDNANAPAKTGTGAATETAGRPGSGRPVLTSIKEAEKAFVEQGGHADKLDGQRKLEELRQKYPGAGERLDAINKHLAEPTAETVDDGAHEAATSPKNGLAEPSQAQKEAGNYKKGHITVGPLDISIENPAGSKRKPEYAPLQSHYGYVKGTVGADKDHVDIFVKPVTPPDYNGPVYVVNQHDASGKFDEHKAVLGTGIDTPAKAKAEYLKNYQKGWNGGKSIVEFKNPAAFKQWAESGAKGKPVTQEQASAVSETSPKQSATAGKPVSETSPKAPTGADRSFDQVAPPLNPGERHVTVQRPDGSTYIVAFGDKHWEVEGKKVPAIGRTIKEGRTDGMLPKGDKILEPTKQEKPVAAPAKKPETTKGEKPKAEAEKPAQKPISGPPTPTPRPEGSGAEGGGLAEKGNVSPRAKRPWTEDRVRDTLAKSPAMRGAFARGLTLEEKPIGGGGMAVDVRAGAFHIDVTATAEHEARIDLHGGDGELHLELAVNEELIHVDTVRAQGRDFEKINKAIYEAHKEAIDPLRLWWPGSAPWMMSAEWIRMLVQRRTLGKITEEAFGQDRPSLGYKLDELYRLLDLPQPPIIERLVSKVTNLAPDKGMATGKNPPPIPETKPPAVTAPSGAIEPELDKALDEAFKNLFVAEFKEPISHFAEKNERDFLSNFAAQRGFSDTKGMTASDPALLEQAKREYAEQKQLLRAATMPYSAGDMKAQAKWLEAQATKRGTTIADLAKNTPTLFDRLASGWRKSHPLEKGLLRAGEATDQKAIPPEKLAGFISVAQAMVKQGIDTPEKMASLLEAKFAGKARPFSQALWDAVGMIRPGLRGTHDWTTIYGALPKVRTPAENVARAVKNRLTTGPMTRAELTALAEGNGLTAKEADEAAELGITQRAREIAQGTGTAEWKYAQMVQLYENQPNLTAKTSTSKVNQAYSTPAPLAFTASRLADIAGGKSIYEPTAGNGMLLIEADPAKQRVTANELDPKRFASLRESFKGATPFDAVRWAPGPAEGIDRVIANPPFGTLLDKEGEPIHFYSSGLPPTKQLDHAIAWKALAAMKDDSRAVLIVGGKNIVDPDERAQAYARQDFWPALYRDYKVVDHFTVDGDLYKKMGAGWPVDVIVIAGRGASAIQLPNAAAPRIIASWDELGKEIGRTDQERIDAGKYDAAKDREKVGGIFEDIRGIVDANGSPGRGERTEPTQTGNEPGATGRSPLSGDQGQQPPAERPVGTSPETAGERAGAVGVGPDEQLPDQQQRRQPVDPESFRVPYVPQNTLPAFKVFIPTYLEAPVRESLEKLKDEVGPLDVFVSKSLGYPEKAPMSKYFSAEQIDSLAQAISAVDQGVGDINGDQGGLGKGRVAAGMMAYALQKGWIPIFVTQDEKLYAEMIKDLHNIGRSDIIPMFTNSGINFEDHTGAGWKQGKSQPLMQQIIADGALPMGIKAMFTSYAQIGTDVPPGWRSSAEGKAHAQGLNVPVPPGFKMLALQKLAPKAMIIADESHLASGQSIAGHRLHELLGNAKGVYYSSATFAKRPDSMGIYSFTTLSHATTDMMELIDAMKQGGTPLQQVVSHILAKDGLYSRRERDFSGVVFRSHINEDTAERDRKLADNYTAGLREILDLSNTMKDTSRKFNAIMSRLGKKFSLKYAPKIESANFSAKLHNLIKQYLFAIKAESVVQRAIVGVKEGFTNAKGETRPHKIVVTFENTMEAPILDLKASNRPLTFNGMLLNYLDKQRVLKVKGTGAGQNEVTTISDTPDPEFEHLSNDQLATILIDEVHTNEEGQRVGNVNEKAASELFRRIMSEAFQKAEEKIKGLDLADMPLSPIDFMKRRMTAEGLGVVEMTGREAGIDEDGAIYDIAPSSHTKRAHIKIIREFNSDPKVHVLLMNAAGSVGISLHSSEEFKDQTPRALLNAQPNLDINKFMQTNWRIDRTGQVHQPYYELIQSALAAELRPNAILTKKMASLNANTTSNAESEMSQGASGVNIFNQYGDEVVHNYLRSDKDFVTLLAIDKILDAKGNLYPFDAIRQIYPEDGKFATAITGRVGVLPEYDARQFWDKVQADYDALITYLNETGENELTTDTVDLKAETLSSKELTAGRPNPTSGFDEPSHLEKIKADIGLKPLPVKEVIEMMGKLNAWDIEQAWKASAAEWKKTELARQIEKAVTWKPEKEQALETKWREAEETIRNSINMIGSGLHIKTRRGIDGYGAVTAVHMDPEHPLVPSKQIFEVHVNTTKRKIRIPASQLHDDARHAATDFASVYEATAERSNERYIITGNLLKAYLAIKDSAPTAKIVNYTTAAGDMKQGILMPAKFDPGQLAAKREVEDANQFKQLLDAGRAVNAAGDVISIVKAPNGAGYVMRVPASKIMGGAYWRDPELQVLMDQTQGQFIQRGNAMVGRFTDTAKVFKRLGELGAGLTYREQSQQLQVAQFNPLKGGKALYTDDVEPIAKSIGMGVKEALVMLRKVISPRVGVRAEGTDAVMRMLGKQYEKAYQTDRVLDAWNDAVQKQPRPEQIDFVDRMKKGEKQPTPELQTLADTERAIDTDSWEAANAAWRDWYDALGRPMVEPPLKWKEDHFRVLWKVIPGSNDAEKAAWIGKTRRPLRGSMGQHKQSTLDDMSEGIGLGGVPYSYNHVEMFKRAQADLWKTTTVLHLLAFMKRNGFMEYVKGPFPKAPDGAVAVDDAAFKKYFPAESGEGLIAAGQYFVEEGMGRLLNNYLSRDLVRQVAVGRGLIWIKNATTQLELMLSPFHAIFETIETVGSNLGLGLQKLVNRGILGGNAKVAVEGLLDMIKAPATPITQAGLGAQFRKALINPDEFFKSAEGKAMLKQYPNAREAADAIFAAGFKPPELEQDWRNNSIKTFLDAISDIKAGESDNYIGAGLRGLPAFNEMVMKPLFDRYIPNLKVAQFLKEFSEAVAEDEQRYGDHGYYIDRSGKKWFRPYTRAQLARKVWDFVEDRFGEMNYDKIFWNRTFKSGMQLMFRSVTWKGGSVRAFGNAFIGQGKEFVDAFKEGRAPELHRNMAWLFGMCLLTAALGTIIQETLAGKAPASLTDLVFPRIDPKDDKIRVSLPTYFKDLVHLIHSPTTYVTSSLSGWIGRLADLWRNKDYYGTQIHDNDDPVVKQATDISKYLSQTLLPFSIRGYKNLSASDVGTLRKAMSLMGVQPAPRFIGQTSAERKASEYWQGQRSEAGIAPGQLESKLEKHRLVSQIEHGHAPNISEALAKGTIKPNDVKSIYQRASMGTLPSQVLHMPLWEAEKIYQSANLKERSALEAIMAKKRANAATRNHPAFSGF